MAAKILLVEDDNNLREIYEARLLAEGYVIVTAKDGEEALVVAKAEKPDLVISDVMMPRISGFEMLDILRNTEELKYTKVIMLTALGQADDKTRANSLGADRYLVKSQVTLEDIVKAAHELIEGAAKAEPSSPSPTPLPGQSTATAGTPTTASSSAMAPQAAPLSNPSSAAPITSAPTTPGATEQGETSQVSAPAEAAASSDVAPATTDAAQTDAPSTTPPNPAPQATPSPSDTSQLPPNNSGELAELDTPTVNEEKETVGEQIGEFVDHKDTSPEQSTPPTSTPDSTAPTANATRDDEVLSDALHDLSTKSSDTTTTEPLTSSAPTTPDTSTSSPDAKESETTDSESSSANNSVTIAHKKVIEPIKSEPKPGLDELLASEEAKGITSTSDNSPMIISPDPAPNGPSAGSGLQPGSMIQPGSSTPPPPSPDKPSDDDPNSIAL